MLHWLMFTGLAMIWGSSFLLIKIGVERLDPIVLVTGRVSTAMFAFLLTFILMRKWFPRDRKSTLIIMLVGILNTAVPFFLITWGETRIDSGLAGVLNATTPLFSLIIAHLALHDDKIDLRKIIGLIAGFGGAALLATRGSPEAATGQVTNAVEGQIAVMVASFSYAVSAVLIRRYLRAYDALTVSGGTNIVGGITLLIFSLVFIRPLPVLAELPIGVIAAVVTLGLLNTFVASLLYMRLINAWGASRATMITYAVAPVSLLFGAIFNHELIDVHLLIGAALIVGGVAVVNLGRSAPTPAPRAEPIPAPPPIGR